MRLISELADRDLAWAQVGHPDRTHELRAGGEVVAVLHWQKGFRARATAGNDCWTFARAGFG